MCRRLGDIFDRDHHARGHHERSRQQHGQRGLAGGSSRFEHSPASAIWLVSSYQIALAVFLLPLSALGEIHGYRRVYLSGLTLFSISSAAVSMSDSFLTIMLARVTQGLGAAGILGVNIAIVRFVYPKRALGRGIGINSFVAASAVTAGAPIAANAWIAGSTTAIASSAKSPHGRSNETLPALVSNGCSQPTRPAPKWAGPIQSYPKSHNHCAGVLVRASRGACDRAAAKPEHWVVFVGKGLVASLIDKE